MALVVFVRGLNVGGHRRFRPAALAGRLRHLDIVNIGATGTFVVRAPVGRTALRAEIARRLPFEAHIMICDGRDVVRTAARDYFAGHPERPDVIRFVSVLARAPRTAPRLPVQLPPRGRWIVHVLARDGRLVVGLHRREMKAIGALGELDRLFGAPATTRSWGTLAAIARVLERPRREPR